MIPKEILHMNANMPKELAKLSMYDEQEALEILVAWGEGTATLRELWNRVETKLQEYTE